MLTKNNNIISKRKIEGKNHLYSCCTVANGFKTFATIRVEEISDLLRKV